jgi:hypothetical protein
VPACSSFQDGVPLLVGLLVLGYGPMVWRGLLLIVACSLPPAGLEIANAGFGTACWSFVTGATVHLGRLSNRIDVGALLWRLGVTSETVQVMAGLAVAVAALVFLARLPAQLRRLSYPPTLCVMVLLTIEPIYHQAYAMLRVGGAVVPLIMVAARTRAMMPSFALALGSSALSSFAVCVLVAPVALLGMGLCAAVVAWRDTARIRQLVPAATLYGWGADPALELAA